MTTRNIETLRASIRALSDRATASVLLDVADSAWSWGNNPLPSPVTKANGFRPVATPVQSAGSVAWGDITGKPDTYAPSPHLHQWSDIAGAPDTAVRWPTWDEVTGKPTTFAPSAHTHLKADITDFAHTHVAGDISGLSGLYLPLAGGIMNNDAQVYLYDAPNTNWTDSALLSAGLTYFRRTANDSSYNYDMYLNGHEALIQATTSGSAYLRSTRMNIWGFEDSYASTTDGEYGNLAYHGLSFRQKKSAGSELDTATTSAGYFKIEHGIASDGVNISTIMRSITADVTTTHPTITVSGSLGVATIDHVWFSMRDVGSTLVSKLSNNSLTFDGTDPDYGAAYGGGGMSIDGAGASSCSFSSLSTCFVGQDFDIRNNKRLLIGGSEAISSARVGSLTGLTVSSLTASFMVRASTGGSIINSRIYDDGSSATIEARECGFDSRKTIPYGTAGTTSTVGAMFGDSQFAVDQDNPWKVYLQVEKTSGTVSRAQLAIVNRAAANGIEVQNMMYFFRNLVQSNYAFKAQAGIGFFGVTPPATRPTASANATDLATAITLVNNLKLALTGCGLMQ